jgi:4-alpha-glucanotransferase
MSEQYPERSRLARACGIGLHYYDGMGSRTEVSPESLERLLASLGRPAANEREAARQLQAIAQARRDALAPAGIVTRAPGTLDVPLEEDTQAGASRVEWRLDTEEGEVHAGSAAWDTLSPSPPDAADPDLQRRLLRIEAPFGPGYHQLQVQLATANGSRSACARVIAAPPHSYLPESPARCWGVGAQLYGLRSATNLGLGTYQDLARLAELGAAAGATFIGSSPLHALFPADPNHVGPYSPSSRRFLNIAHLELTEIPGFAECEPAHRLATTRADALAQLRNQELVDYVAVAKLTRPVLEALFDAFRQRPQDDPEARRFRAFQARAGEALEVHALFDALHEHFHAQGAWFWREWPAAFRQAGTEAVHRFAAEHAQRVEFFAWLQWLADGQLAQAHERARAAGMALGIYADMAVAVNHGGSAAWSNHDLVPPDVSVGAPPDAFNTLGQNWGLAPFSPLQLRARGFMPFAADVAATMRHAGAIRVDHAMKLQRLFWIPEGAAGREGAYVDYPRDELLAVLALESHRNRCVVIAEDLGTVPDGFREALAREHILTYKIFYFERGEQETFTAPADYAAGALVAATTHDLPTLRGLLAQRDLEWREQLNLYPDDAARAAARAERERSLRQLRIALKDAGLLDESENDSDERLVVAIHAYVARTPSRLLVIQAEDLAGCVEQPNLPGTVDEHPNWRRRLPVPVEALFDGELARQVIAAVRAERGPQ